jgi:hypothetical protein
MTAYLIGSYIGALVVTLLISRFAQRVLRKWFTPKQALLRAFLSVSLFAVALLSLTKGTAGGVGEFLLIYLPCLMLWLCVDYFRLRP